MTLLVVCPFFMVLLVLGSGLLCKTTDCGVDFSQDSVHEELKWELDCGRFVKIPHYSSVDSSIFLMAISSIIPYDTPKKTCVLMERPKQKDSQNDFFKPKYFLRVDKHPSHCNQVKNDIAFNQVESYYIAKFEVSKKCGQIHEDKFQENVQTSNLYLEVREVCFQLFGFPVYFVVFKRLAVTLAILLGAFFINQLMWLPFQKSSKDKQI